MRRSLALLLFVTLSWSAAAQEVYSAREMRQVAEMAVLASYCDMPRARRTINSYAKGIGGYDRVVAKMTAELAADRQPDAGACALGTQIMPGVLQGLKANPPIR